VVRLILGREQENGAPGRSLRERGVLYRRWRARIAAGRDASIHLYREDYAWAGRVYQRLG
jgi:hypothetical protein